MYFHWVNDSRTELNQDAWPRKGRCWLHFREPWELGLEWKAFSKEVAASVWLQADESEVTFRAAFALATIYFSVKIPRSWMAHILPSRTVTGYFGGNRGKTVTVQEDRGIRFSFEGWLGFSWSFWMHPHEWRSNEPWYRRGSFSLPDFLFGSRKHTRRDVETRHVLVSMPEGDYDARATLFVSTWKRPRWPISRRLIRVNIDVPGGIPKPGKGENSWDCGDDACFGLTTPARTIEDAVGAMVASVSRDRRKHGGAQWMPDSLPPHVLA